MNNKKRSTKTGKVLRQIWGSIALAALVIAWLFGFTQTTSFVDTLRTHFSTEVVNPVVNTRSAFDVIDSDQSQRIYAAQAQGYGGPLSIAFTLDQSNKVVDVMLLDHVDTPGYVANVLNQRFLSRLEGKAISDSFSVGDDVDGISGATLTVVGITDAVRKAAHETAINQGLSVAEVPVEWRIKMSDALITILIILVLFERRLPMAVRKYHLVTVGILSVSVLGYWANMALSLSSVSSFLLGYFPDPRQNLTIYLVFATVLFGIVWLGKNIYCSSLCPFHHIQRWAHKLGGNNWPIPELIKKHSIDMINLLLWVSLMLIFLSRNPAISGYEPFSMLFSLDGIGVQWYLLPLALFGSFFVKDFWCRLFCPLGRGINFVVAKRQSFKKAVSSILETPNRRDA